MKCPIVTDLQKVAAALEDVGPGLSIEVIHLVLRAGEIARHGVDQLLDPANAGGWEAFRYRVRTLRQELLLHGWTPDNHKGASLVVSPDKKKQIWIMVGDETTGLTGTPTTFRKKGPTFQELVERNRQLFLGPEFAPTEEDERDLDAALAARETWVLLVHNFLEMQDGQRHAIVRAEFSLAKAMNGARPTDWHARYKIPELLVELPKTDAADFMQGDDLEIPVVRKQDVASDSEILLASAFQNEAINDDDVQVPVTPVGDASDNSISDQG